MAENSEKYPEGDISVAEECVLLWEDVTGENGDVIAEGSQDITKEGLMKMMVTMNQNMAARASSVASLGGALKRFHTESNSNQPSKKQKSNSNVIIEDDHQTVDEIDASSCSDSAQLRAIMAPKLKLPNRWPSPRICLAKLRVTSTKMKTLQLESQRDLPRLLSNVSQRLMAKRNSRKNWDNTCAQIRQDLQTASI